MKEFNHKIKRFSHMKYFIKTDAIPDSVVIAQQSKMYHSK